MSAAELFAGAGASPGVETWRIEQMKPVKQANFTGKFHTGDSYIVLHTWESKGSTLMNVHFWIGAESTRDEAGAAALLTVELDQLLGDLPTQFRETQGSESEEFLQLWPAGARYLAGGVDSAFTAVDRDAYTTRLLHVKGKRNVRVMQVPVALASLNSGDVFLLDTGTTVAQWNGRDASRAEKAKALDVALAVRSEEHGGKSSVVAIDESATDFEDDATRAFFSVLSGLEDGVVLSAEDAARLASRIKSAAEGGDDDAVSEARAGAGAVRLYHLRDDEKTGTLTLTERVDRPLLRDCLQTDDVFVLCAGGGVYVWVGKKASTTERAGANEFLAGGERAAKFLDANGLRADTPVKIVKQGTEPALFKQAFHRWGSDSSAPSRGARKTAEARIDPKTKSEVDVEALVAGGGASARDARGVAFDDGQSGVLLVWRVEDFKLAPVKEASHGQFFCGDSYVLHYAYDDGKRHVVYFWQGRESSQDEKAASALLAKEVDDALGGRATQVRVTQGKEPDHFCALFQGRMVVRSGGKASGFRNVGAEDVYDEDGVCLYHVRGASEANVRAVQVADDAACLNSGDCFILTLEAKEARCVEDEKGVVTKRPPSDPRVLVWVGAGSSAAERECAARVATLLAPGVGVGSSRVETVAEGAEPAVFWEHIGGKKPYAKFSAELAPASDPRLFQLCDAAAGGRGIRAEEIFNFTQDDLDDDDVMLLDVASEVFLWIGKCANENEKRESLVLAQRYVAAMAATDGRDVDTPITTVPAGAEPPPFTAHFIAWDASKASATFVDPYELKLKQAMAANPSTLELPTLRKAPAKKDASKNTERVGGAAPSAAETPGAAFEMPALREIARPAGTGGSNVSTPVKTGAGVDTEEASFSTPKSTPGAPSPWSGVAEITTPGGSKVLSYDALVKMDGTAGIDMARKESYLSEGEFKTVFGMERDAFAKLAEWKRKDAKKKVGLF